MPIEDATRLTAGYYGLPLLLTIAVEVPILFALTDREPRTALFGVLVNMLTNPPAMLVVLTVGYALGRTTTPFWPVASLLVGIEAAIVLIESVALVWVLGLTRGRALAISVLANLASIAVGFRFLSYL